MVEKEDGGSEDDLEKKITWILNGLMVVGGLIYILLNSFLLSSWVKQFKNYSVKASAENCVNTYYVLEQDWSVDDSGEQADGSE